MAGGIAKQFVDKCNMRQKLIHWLNSAKIPVTSNPYGDYGNTAPSLLGKAVLIDGVFNLITKLWTYEKPKYGDLYLSLLDMKQQILDNRISQIAMPRIGCGIDGLSWVAVSIMIQKIFEDTNIEILIVTLPSGEKML